MALSLIGGQVSLLFWNLNADRSFELRSALSETQRLVSLSLEFVVRALVQWRIADWQAWGNERTCSCRQLRPVEHLSWRLGPVSSMGPRRPHDLQREGAVARHPHLRNAAAVWGDEWQACSDSAVPSALPAVLQPDLAGEPHSDVLVDGGVSTIAALRAP